MTNINIISKYSEDKEKKCIINQKSNQIFLKRNNNTFTSYNLKKENSSFAHINTIENKKKIIYHEYFDKVLLSRGSIRKIDHKKTIHNSDKKADINYFSFLKYIRAIMFQSPKNIHNFIRIFRKHLLSEEHLLKNHIKTIFLEKQHNLNGEEKTNVLECFNEL